jgi:hypothetical protein
MARIIPKMARDAAISFNAWRKKHAFRSLESMPDLALFTLITGFGLVRGCQRSLLAMYQNYV